MYYSNLMQPSDGTPCIDVDKLGVTPLDAPINPDNEVEKAITDSPQDNTETNDSSKTGDIPGPELRFLGQQQNVAPSSSQLYFLVENPYIYLYKNFATAK